MLSDAVSEAALKYDFLIKESIANMHTPGQIKY